MRGKSQRQIQEASEARRDFRSLNRKLIKEWTQAELPPDWWLMVFRYIYRRQQRAGEYIRNEYGIEVQLPDWLEQLLVDVRRRGASHEQIVALRLQLGPPLVADPERFLECVPRSQQDLDRYRAAGLRYTLFHAVCWRMSEVISDNLPAEAVRESKLRLPLPPETARALNLGVANVMLSVPYLIASLAGDVMSLSSVPKEAKAATLYLAGFVGSYHGGSKNRRRNHALGVTEQLDALLGSIRLAWDERPPEEHIYPGIGRTSLVSRVDKMLEALGNEAGIQRDRPLTHAKARWHHARDETGLCAMGL